jgi:putative copper export protein
MRVRARSVPVIAHRCSPESRAVQCTLTGVTLYVASVYLHILAAATWVGGIIFLVLVVVPALRRSPNPDLMREAVVRFRAVAWAAFAVLLATGLYNLHARGIGWTELTSPEFRATASGKALLIKLACFAGVLALSAVHDFSIGPRALRAMEQKSPDAQRLRKQTGWIGRINGVVTLVIVLCAVIVVRGC